MSTTDIILSSSIPSTWTTMNESTSGIPPPRELGTVTVTILSVISAIASLLTFLGNLLVLVAFKREHRLRIVSNYFIFSMAVADMTIGLCSMPLYTSYYLLSSWPFGSVICDIWLSLDFLCCAASVLGILLISIDRYHVLSNPMTYRQTMTKKRALVLITVSWVASAILFSVPIIGWQYIEGKRTVKADACEVQFFSNPLYTILSIVIIYWLPLLIILILYAKIYRLTRKLVRREAKIIGRLSTRETTSSRASHQLRPRDVDAHREPDSDDWDDVAQKMDAPNLDSSSYIAQCETKLHNILKSEVLVQTNGCQKQNHLSPSATPNNDGSPTVQKQQRKQQNFVDNLDIRRSKVHSCPDTEEDRTTYSYQYDRTPSSNNKTLYRYSKDGGPSFSRISTESDVELDGERVRMTRPNSCQSLASEKKSIKSVLNLKENNLARTLTSVIISLKEAKAVRTLSVLLGAFVLCWTPYSVLIIVKAACSSCVGDDFFSFSYYLCYINSTFNPVCYAMSNRGFRIAFKRILTCGKKRYEWRDTF